jgi:hypothetical protein
VEEFTEHWILRIPPHEAVTYLALSNVCRIENRKVTCVSTLRGELFEDQLIKQDSCSVQ